MKLHKLTTCACESVEEQTATKMIGPLIRNTNLWFPAVMLLQHKIGRMKYKREKVVSHDKLY